MNKETKNYAYIRGLICLYNFREIPEAIHGIFTTEEHERASRDRERQETGHREWS